MSSARRPALIAILLLSLLLPAGLHGAGDKPGKSSTAQKKDGKGVAAKPVVINGELAGTDARDRKRKGSPAKMHKVELKKGVCYVIDLVSNDFDAFLRLEDAKGNDLAEDDDGGGQKNARLFFIPPQTAEYLLVATCYTPRTGKYRLTVQEANLPAEPLKLDGGSATVKGKLTVTSTRSPFSPHNNSKLFRVDLKAGKTYVIDLVSTDFDPYLSLGDASLRLLASDDDSGGKEDKSGKWNARIRFPCKEDASYFIVASGLSHPEGAFELKVRAAD